MKTVQISSEIDLFTVSKVLALRGPNLWSNHTVLECWIELPTTYKLSDRSIAHILAVIPSLRASFYEINHKTESCLLLNLLLATTLHLQSHITPQINFGKIVTLTKANSFRLLIQYKDEAIARHAFEVAKEIVSFIITENREAELSSIIADAVTDLRSLSHEICLGPSTRAIVEAAEKRDIPCVRLNEGSLVQLGFGSKQKKILAAATSATSAIAEDIAQDKDLTRTLLFQVGLPVPKGRAVSSSEDAWKAAIEIGLPVVVKPRDGNQGRGVALNLYTRDQIATAYCNATNESKSIIVEKYFKGNNYRIFVIDNKVVAASLCIPAHVIGDGIHTILELVDEINQDPRRAPDHAAALSSIHIDAVAVAVLAEQDVTADSIPKCGEIIYVRRNGNLSTGGTAEDVTAVVHASLGSIAVEAAKVIGLDVCGIDIIAQDICLPLSDNNGVIIEVNARPGLRMHIHPLEGESRAFGEAIIDSLFPNNCNGRIPIIAITGVNGKTTTRFIAHLLTNDTTTVGMCNTDGVFIGSRILDRGDCSGPKSARKILSDVLVDVAVLETARGGILREGLGFDRCDIAVITNIGSGDHLGIDEIETPEQLAMVKRCLVKAVPDCGTAVLNAEDPLVVSMAETCTCQTVLFAKDSTNHLIAKHRAAGNKAVYVENESLILAEGITEVKFLDLVDIPLTGGGKIGFQIENTLAAVAAAWSYGVDIGHLRARAQSFFSDVDQNTARFNVIEKDGATIIIDYMHNIDALQALIAALEHFKDSRRIATYSEAGDRRDSEIIEQGRLLGEAFDEVLLYEGNYTRGRKPGEIMDLISKGLENASRTQKVECIHGHITALDKLLENTRPGDLIVIQADHAHETVEHVKKRCFAL